MVHVTKEPLQTGLRSWTSGLVLSILILVLGLVPSRLAPQSQPALTSAQASASGIQSPPSASTGDTLCFDVLLPLSGNNGYEVELQGDLAYHAGPAGLRVFSVAAPNQMTLLGALNTADALTSVEIRGRLAYVVEVFVVANRSELHVIDVSDSTRPAILGSIALPGIVAKDLIVDGDWAYVAGHAPRAGYVDAVHILNIADSSQPLQVNTWPTGEAPEHLAFDSPHLFVGVSGRGILVLDVTDPAALDSLTVIDFPEPIYGELLVHAGHLYVTDRRLTVFDIGNAAAPVQVYTLDSAGLEIYDITIAGPGLLLAAQSSDGLRFYDITNPSAVMPLSGSGPWIAGGSVAAAQDYAIVSDWRGLLRYCADSGCVSSCINCGNGVVDLLELCDDGNVIPGDGCDESCLPECPGEIGGDVDANGSINSADIIFAVNYIWKSGPPPTPCIAYADIDCSGSVTSADVIGLVAYVFRSGQEPCLWCRSPLMVECS